MRELTAIELATLVRGYPWPSSGVICDVAGGIGTLLAAIRRWRRPSSPRRGPTNRLRLHEYSRIYAIRAIDLT